MYKLKNYKILTSLLILTFTTNAPADVLVEPFLGYRVGTFGYKVGNSAANWDVTGPAYGVRAAYQSDSWLLGFDITQGKLNSKIQSTGGQGDTSSSNINQLHLLAGWKGRSFRAWIGYSLTNEFSISSSGSDSKYTGSNGKLGIGYLMFSKVYLNGEFFMSTFTPSPGTLNIPGATYGDTGALLSLSYPLKFK